MEQFVERFDPPSRPDWPSRSAKASPDLGSLVALGCQPGWQPGAEPAVGAAIHPDVGAGEVLQQQCQESGVSNPALWHVNLLLQTTAAAVPILFFTNRFGVDAEARQLRPLAQAAFDFGKPGEARQRDDVVLFGELVHCVSSEHKRMVATCRPLPDLSARSWPA